MTQVLDYEAIVNASPYIYLFLAPDLTIVGVNDAFLRANGMARANIVGRNLLEVFPPDLDNPASIVKFQTSIARVLASGKPDTITLIHYPIPNPEPGATGMIDRYWSVVHTPILDAAGKVSFLVQNPIDVTELYSLKKTLHAADATPEPCSQAENSILNRSQALEAANRMLDDELNSLRRLFAQAPGFIAAVRGPQYIFELANEAYYQLVGRRDLIGKPLREAFSDLEGQMFFSMLDKVYSTGEAFVGHDMKVVFQPDPNGPADETYIDIVVQPITGPDGSVVSLLFEGNDITAQKRTQDELRISNERLSLAIEGSGDGLWDWDMRTDEVIYSKRWKEMLGYNEDEIGDTREEWLSRLHPEDASRTMGAMQHCIEGKTDVYRDEHRLRAKGGHWIWLLSRGVVVARDEKGQALRMIGTEGDITAKKESDDRVWHHANFDTLTGLPNRRLFRDRLDHEVRKGQRTGMRAALLFIDLDRFKEVNDLLGHDVGDQLLAQAARRLCACVRNSDTVARLGGDEFTVILSELDNLAHVEQIAQKLLAALAEPFRLGNEVAYVSGSIGITMYPADAKEPEELIRNADQAMYTAKNAGRNQFCYFTRSMQEQAHLRLRLGGDLRRALHAGQLRVYYQPVVDLSTGRIVKAEALLRWQHPGLGTVDPSLFIPLAEESGLINEIGDWVFRQAAACSQRWSTQFGVPFQVSVNKSPVQFLAQAKEIDWAHHLHKLGLPGNSIAVEITEGVLLNASPLVSDELLKYRDAGIQVAIDDFGTGYSSMAYLKKFDIDYLKIDQSFVHDIVDDDSDRAIAESVIVMAHRLGLKVIAEGIETAEQERLLIAAGCDFGQGYLYAGAAPPDDFEHLLAMEIQAAGSHVH